MAAVKTGGLGTVRGLWLFVYSVVAAGTRAVPAHPRSCSSVSLPLSPATPSPLALSQVFGTAPPAFAMRRFLPKHPSTHWAEPRHFRMSCYEVSTPAWLDFTAELRVWGCFWTAPEMEFLSSSVIPAEQQRTQTHLYTYFSGSEYWSHQREEDPTSLGFPSPSQYFTPGFGREQLCHAGSSTEERPGERGLVQEFSTETQRSPWQDQLPRCWSQHRVLGCQVCSQVLPEIMQEIVLLEKHNQECSQCSVLSQEAPPVLKSCLIPLDKNCTLGPFVLCVVTPHPLGFFTVRHRFHGSRLESCGSP